MYFVRKKFLLFLFFIVLIFTVFFSCFCKKEQEVYIDIYDRYVYVENLKSSRVEKTSLFNSINFDGAPLVYNSEENNYYFTIPMDYDKNLNDIDINILSDSNVNYIITNSDYNREQYYDLDSDKILKIFVYNSSSYEEINISFTYLPIINITTKNNITDKKSDSIVQIYDPYYLENSNEFYSKYSTKIKIRGSISSLYPKKSYKISLDNTVSFLGMQKNNEWILDALYSDSSKMRNMLSSQLWNDIIDGESNAKIKNYLNCKYVEVYVNNSYRGLYLLKEQLNENSLSLNNKILIKGSGYNRMNYYSYFIRNNFSDEYINYEMKYPNNSEHSYISWYTILKKMQNYHLNEHISDELINSTFYRNNLIDYELLIAFSKAVDNSTTKNIYIEYDFLSDKLIYIPWDLDQTFGMTWTNTNTDTYMTYEFDKYDELFSSLYEVFSPSFNRSLREKYVYLRKNVLNSKNVDQYLNSYKDLLVRSGAAKRDGDRWGSYDLQYEVDSISEWTRNRIGVLDKYFDC